MFVEDELHVLIKCPIYFDLRNDLFKRACHLVNDFKEQSELDQFIFMLSEPNLVRHVARTLNDILQKRQILSTTV